LRVGVVLPPACTTPAGRRFDHVRIQNPQTECPISRSQFLAEAKSVEVVINGVPMVAEVKEFSTGSFGWHFGDKVTIKVGDTLVKCQVGLTVTCIGSKDLPKNWPKRRRCCARATAPA